MFSDKQQLGYLIHILLPWKLGLSFHWRIVQGTENWIDSKKVKTNTAHNCQKMMFQTIWNRFHSIWSVLKIDQNDKLWPDFKLIEQDFVKNVFINHWIIPHIFDKTSAQVTWGKNVKLNLKISAKVIYCLDFFLCLLDWKGRSCLAASNWFKERSVFPWQKDGHVSISELLYNDV